MVVCACCGKQASKTKTIPKTGLPSCNSMEVSRLVSVRSSVSQATHSYTSASDPGLSLNPTKCKKETNPGKAKLSSEIEMVAGKGQEDNSHLCVNFWLWYLMVFLVPLHCGCISNSCVAASLISPTPIHTHKRAHPITYSSLKRCHFLAQKSVPCSSFTPK